MRAATFPLIAALALAGCSEGRQIAPPPGPSLCGKPLCEASCACDVSTACDPDCSACDPECGECRPASLTCTAPRDAGPGDGSGLPESDGGSLPGSDGGARDAAVASECTSHAECGGRLCDRARGRCAECRTTEDCDRGERCQDGACAATPTCQSDLTCTPMGLVCDARAGRCVQCNSAAECGGAPCLGHSCVPTIACQSSLECASLHMVCGPALPPAWPTEFAGQGCGECNGVVDCAAGETCRERLCTPVCAGRICGVVDGASCGTCPGDGACLESGQACVESVGLFGAQYFLDAGDRLFFGDDGRSGDGTIVEVIGSGQPRVVTRAPANTYIDGLVMNSSRIYWALTNGEIHTRARTGGAVSPFVTVPGTPTHTWCQALAADDSFVVCGLVDYGNAANSGLYRFPVGGGMGTRFDPAVQPSGLFIDGGTVFWALFNDDLVGKTEIATGRRTILSREQGTLLAVVAGQAYFESTSDQIRRVPAGSTSAQTLVSQHRWVSASTDTLYLVDRATDTLVRTQLDGSGRVEIAREEELGVGQIRHAFRRADGLYVVGEFGGAKITP